MNWLRIKFIEDFVVFLLKEIAKIVEGFGIPGNYGIAIIIITIMMRIALLPLTLKQEKSMKKMKELEPELNKLKEKYKDNPQELQKKMGELYKENNVNPLGGCLPILIQLPVFLALFYAFNGNTIPNTATFLWFNLKKPDALFNIGKFTFNLLPILNTGVTFLQQKVMSSASGGAQENSQMKTMMYTLPIMMLILFYNMPSGVTLYYLVSGFLSVVQQYFVMKGRSKDE